MKLHTGLILSLFGIGVLLGGCSGGTGGTGVNNPPAGTDVSSGAVTDFGSIFVNGVEFSTNGASILRDDVPVNENELRRGMVVNVRGSINSSTSGSATTVFVEEAVRGLVESKSGTANAGTFVVMGQSVRADDSTLYDNNVPDFASISAGHLMEVHGYRLVDGTIMATFIERKTAPVVYSVRGTVAGHNAGTQSFTVGALTVNYGGAIIGDMPAPSGSNWNSLFVEIKGSTCLGSPVCGTLTASKVEPNGLGVNDAGRAEIEGYVTALSSTSDFTIGTQHVVTNGSTVFSGGLQSEIVLGIKLEAEGTLSGGILTASKVSFRDNIRFESDIASIDAGAGTLTLVGLPGITVAVNSFTEFDGSGSPSSLGDFAVSDHVRIRGRLASGNTVIASDVEKRSADTRVILQGPVGSVSNPSVVILGVTVNTTGIADGSFHNVNDGYLGRAAFFATVVPNMLVKARGDLGMGGTVTWDQIELED